MSNSWITECSGKTVQHLQYLPYGERYVDQRVSGYHERFTFTGKERDEETGYGYFGARYMDHELMTMWLSVDPLADKYPGISPYAYCAWNPVKLIDPDGRDIWEINKEGKIVNHIKDKNKDAFFMVDNDGNRKESIAFKYGTIKGYKKGSDATSSESAGAELFKFFADNTMIEYGLINTESNGSTVMTNHKESSVGASKMAKEMNDDGQKITSIVHNHPHNTNPSGFNKDSKQGDKFSALQLLESQGRLVDRFVYKPKNGSLVSYDNKQIYGNMSWGTVFHPSSERINSYPSTRRFPGVGLPPK